MKKIFLSLFISLFFYGISNANCPTAHAVQHPGEGAINVICNPSGSCLHTPRFWCLSGGATNNNDGNTFFWQQYSGTIWWFNGNWSNTGVEGCCGMWDTAVSFDSKTMMAVVEFAFNEGATNHAGYTNVEVCERPIAGGSYAFWRDYNIDSSAIPVPAIGSVVSGGLGGTSTFNVTGWKTGTNIDYYIKLEDNSDGMNLALNARCTPGGTGACPAPIAGYQIVAIGVGCDTNPCTPTSSPAYPTTSQVSSWNLAVTNGFLSGRTPQFPHNDVLVTNPNTEGYVVVAARMAYADGFAGVYTSGNGLAFRIGTLGAEISDLAAAYIQTGLVKVSWKSVVEGGVAGYNVYRSFSPTGTFTKVSSRTIPVTGNEGSIYTYKDRVTSTVPRNVYYKIEIVRPNGQTEMVQDVAVASANPKRIPRL